MKKTSNEINFDADKFTNKLKENNLTIRDAGELIGKSRSFWYSHLKSGKVNRTDLFRFYENLRIQNLKRNNESDNKKMALETGQIIQRELLSGGLIQSCHEKDSKDCFLDFIGLMMDHAFHGLGYTSEFSTCFKGLKITVKIEQQGEPNENK